MYAGRDILGLQPQYRLSIVLFALLQNYLTNLFESRFSHELLSLLFPSFLI